MTPASIRRNLRGPWVVDDDPFEINQFLHPYQGAMYHGIARSNGLSYWPSVAYTFAGSALWEIAGETRRPLATTRLPAASRGRFWANHSFVSPVCCSSAPTMDRAPGGHWRQCSPPRPPASIIRSWHPAGSRAPDAVPFSDIRVQFGATATQRPLTIVSSLAVNHPRLALSMDYGYPGNAGYRHERPFDYFRIESSVSSEGMEQLSTRGLIAGADYGAGRLAGIWGLYGTYDYLRQRTSTSPARRSRSAQPSRHRYPNRWWSELRACGSGLRRTPLALRDPDSERRRDYHYGVAPQALANLRLIAGRRAALDVTAREYFISAVGGFGTGQRDLIFVGDTSLAIRIYRRHALALTYQLAGRSSDLLALPDHTQARSTVGLFYTFLGSGGFGAVR